MNKRSLLFIFGLTTILFLVNQWFSSKGLDKKKQAYEQQQIQQAEVQKTKESDIASRTERFSRRAINVRNSG